MKKQTVKCKLIQNSADSRSISASASPLYSFIVCVNQQLDRASNITVKYHQMKVNLLVRYEQTCCYSFGFIWSYVSVHLVNVNAVAVASRSQLVRETSGCDNNFMML